MDLTRTIAWGGAHDLNNLLMAISGNVSLALMDLPPDAPARESLEQIDVAARAAAALAREVMTALPRVSRPPTLGDLGELSGGLERLATAASGHAVAIRTEALPCPPVLADVPLLRLALLDLVLTLADSSGARGAIVVRSGGAGGDGTPNGSRDARWAVAEVEAEGEGEPSIAARVRSALAEDAVDPAGGVARAAAQTLGGELRVDAGDRVRIRLVLPAYREDEDPEEARPESPAADAAGGAPAATTTASPLHVLVVDDEEILRAMAPRLLAPTGATCEVAADGDEALRLFRTGPGRFDVVLLDQSMPGASGEAVLGRLLEIRPDARIVLMSGYPVGEDEARLRAAGCAGFLQKPFRTAELLQALAEVRAGRASAD